MSISLDQVKKHSQPDDIWIVLHHKVYDVTKYLEDHPGGSAVLLEVAGQDATQAFEEVGHSDEAREQLEPFIVGELPEAEQTDSVEVYRPTFESVPQSAVVDVKPKSSSAPIRKLFKIGLTGLAGASAVTAYHQGWTASGIFHTVAELFSSLHLSSVFDTTNASHDNRFWSGACMATVAQFSLTVSLGLWASTKLDVQEEFTHYAPRRPAKSARFVHLPKTHNLERRKAPVIDPRQWRSFTLTQKQEVAPNVYRLVFALPNPDDVLGLPTGQHIALRATIDGASVSRSYTPTSNNTDVGRIELVVKVYPTGKMTKHLESMKEGESIEIRGPKGAMQYSRQYAKHINMIAGGTGITPMYQLIRAICDDPHDDTRVSLLYANNTEEDILLREELEMFAKKCPENFEMQYVLSNPNEDWKGYRGFVNAELIQRHLAPVHRDNKVLLCGPPPMVNAMKKVLDGMGWTMPPGAMAKATDQVFLF